MGVSFAKVCSMALTFPTKTPCNILVTAAAILISNLSHVFPWSGHPESCKFCQVVDVLKSEAHFMASDGVRPDAAVISLSALSIQVFHSYGLYGSLVNVMLSASLYRFPSSDESEYIRYLCGLR